MFSFKRNTGTPTPTPTPSSVRIVTPQPFVAFKSIAKDSLNSFGEPIVASQADGHTICVDSLWLCNRLDQEIVVNIVLWKEIEGTDQPQETFLARQLVLGAYERKDLLTRSTVYLEAHDLLYAYSDDPDHYFDCIVSYRELVELGTPTPS